MSNIQSLWDPCPYISHVRSAISSRVTQYSFLHIPHSSGRRFWILQIRVFIQAGFVNISWFWTIKKSSVVTKTDFWHFPNSVLCCLLLFCGLYRRRQSQISFEVASEQRPANMFCWVSNQASSPGRPGFSSTPPMIRRVFKHCWLRACNSKDVDALKFQLVRRDIFVMGKINRIVPSVCWC